jgi:Arc/MetJ-type ribon-helix-helix transcriptional regulator
MTNQITVRLPKELIEELDGMIERGRFASRTEAVRVALEDLMAETREAELDDAIVAGYRAVPDDDEFDAMAMANARAMVEEEPW